MSYEGKTVKLRGNGGHSISISALREPPLVMMHVPAGSLSFTCHPAALAEFAQSLVEALNDQVGESER